MSKGNDLLPAALYARVSSERQDVDLSVAAQMRALRDYADKNGYLVVREYIDEAESGRIADRPQFRKMLDEAARPESPFQEILVWKFSRFTRKREHAVAFKSMLRRKGIRVVSITEHADDSPTGKLMEAIIESIDEFYSENLAEEVKRGMREAASRGFWMTSYAPYGYRRVHVPDGPKKRPTLEPDPTADAVVRRIFDMALQGQSNLDIVKALNSEGIPTTNGKRWLKTTIHRILVNEAYTGTLVWGSKAQDNAPPVRVDNAFPAIVTRQEFDRVSRMMHSRAPKKMNPRRAASPYLLSGLLKCETCGKAMTAAEAKSGKYTYYICHSLLKRGAGTCETPRLNARSFEKLVIGQRAAGECPHRVQHPRPGEAAGRGDGRDRPRAAPATGDHRGGAGGGQAQAGPHLAVRRNHRRRDRRRRRPHQGAPRAAGAVGERRPGGQGCAGQAPGVSGQRRHHRRLRQ